MNPHEDTPDLWPERNRIIARHIPEGVRVIDLGAGAQSLRSMLPGRDYTAADVNREGSVPFDMNRGVWPAGEYDVAVMSGVLEYAVDPARVLSRIRHTAPLLLLSYRHGGSLRLRRERQWANHLSRAALEELLEVYRHVRVVDRWKTHYIYRAER